MSSLEYISRLLWSSVSDLTECDIWWTAIDANVAETITDYEHERN
jgi:hypothetical protein